MNNRWFNKTKLLQWFLETTGLSLLLRTYYVKKVLSQNVVVKEEIPTNSNNIKKSKKFSTCATTLLTQIQNKEKPCCLFLGSMQYTSKSTLYLLEKLLHSYHQKICQIFLKISKLWQLWKTYQVWKTFKLKEICKFQREKERGHKYRMGFVYSMLH